MKKIGYKVSLLVLLLLSFFLFSSLSVLAFNQNVIKNQFTEIPKGQTISNIFVIGNDADVYGTVKDAIIVVDGNLSIKSTARVEGLIIVVGGKVLQEEGSVVHDDVININFTKDIMNSLLLGSFLAISTTLLKFSASILLIIFVIITIILAKNKLDILENLMLHSPKKVIIMGLIANILFLSIIVLFSISIIGIPVALAIIIFYLLLLIIGLATISRRLGIIIFPKTEKLYQRAIVGSLIIISMINFPILGVFVLFVFGWISLGMVTLWFLERRKKIKEGK